MGHAHGAWVMGRFGSPAGFGGSATENTTTDTPAGRLVHGAILLRISEGMRGAGESELVR